MSVETLFFIAVLLLIAEAFVPSLGTLGFGGFMAFCWGVYLLIESGFDTFYGLSIQSIIGLGVLIFSAFALFGYFAFQSFQKKISTGIEYMKGQTATVKSWKGSQGHILFEGEDWRAISNDNLSVGDVVIIDDYHKMTLTVSKQP